MIDMKDLERLNKAIDEQSIFRADVTMVGRTSERVPYMVATLSKGMKSDYKCIIYQNEADADSPDLSLVSFVGESIPFIILSIDEEGESLVCSRKVAQEIIKEEMATDFANGTIFEGKITHILNYGAFVNVNGITGLLRNSDYSTDYSEISECYKEGDRIAVRCKEVDDAGRIAWEVIHKYSRTEPVKIDFDIGSVMLGTVSQIKNFAESTGVFVRIGKSIDALCPVPPDLEIEVDSQVAVKITSIDKVKDPIRPRVRGWIMRTM